MTACESMLHSFGILLAQAIKSMLLQEAGIRLHRLRGNSQALQLGAQLDCLPASRAR